MKFDSSCLSYEIVHMKSITTAGGGAISVVDVDDNNVESNARRIAVPVAVARDFIQHNHKITKYLTPLLLCVVSYKDVVIALEAHYLGTKGKLIDVQLDGSVGEWKPRCKWNIDHYVIEKYLPTGTDWLFDGRYLYDVSTSTNTIDLTGGDHQFQAITVRTVDMMKIGELQAPGFDQRTCLVYHSATGTTTITPPIWKDVTSIGSTVVPQGNTDYLFDVIDSHAFVNVNFVMYAGTAVSRQYGYQAIECLDIPRLMVELSTVNVMAVDEAIKQTYNSGHRFTVMMAWAIGLYHRATTLEEETVARRVIKYLTKRALVDSTTFDCSKVFKPGKDQSALDAIEYNATEKLSVSKQYSVVEETRALLKRYTLV